MAAGDNTMRSVSCQAKAHAPALMHQQVIIRKVRDICEHAERVSDLLR
jgi:hypothetical protein